MHDQVEHVTARFGHFDAVTRVRTSASAYAPDATNFSLRVACPSIALLTSSHNMTSGLDCKSWRDHRPGPTPG